MSGHEQAVIPIAADGSRVLLYARRAAVGVCAFALIACGNKFVDKDDVKTERKDDGKERAGAESHSTVAATVATVQAESFDETIDGTGVVSARTGHLATLSAPAATRISNVHVSLGSRVRAGDKLVSFETTAFTGAAASADAALNLAQQSAARARRLVDAGVSPRKDAELAASELAAAQSASVNAHRALQLATLKSPIDGVVTRLTATLGASADAGQTLVEVADTRSLDVQLVLSPALAARVHTGQSVVFRGGSGNDTERIADGKIANVSAVVDSSSRGVVVRVAVTMQKRALRLGESIYGQITADSHQNAAVISDEALVPTGEGFQVFVVDSAGKAHARAVVIGARNSHRVWIREGLKAGETIVTAGAFGMDDGATVVTRKSAP